MLIIYHSRGALPARLAAAMHVGAVGPEPPSGADPLSHVVERLGGVQALEAEGLWDAGADPWGRRVYALGRASRPDVVRRAFHGLADIFELPPRDYLLQHVGPVVAWNDLGVRCLLRLGLPGLASRYQASGMRKCWRAARLAVALAAERLILDDIERR